MEDVYSINSLVKKLPENPVVIDIGANAGFFNILLLSKIKNATILAYEPLLSNTKFFKKVINQNPVLQKHIQLHQAAVTGTEKESLDLFMEDTLENQVVASVFEGFNKDNLKKMTVPCISLTKIVKENNLQKIDLLKMDCEGSEYDIIYNTAQDIIKMADHIAIEVHDVDDKTNNFSSLKIYLESLGYAVSYTPINQFCYAADAVKTSIK
jgi:FkbM family methyltransferase